MSRPLAAVCAALAVVLPPEGGPAHGTKEAGIRAGHAWAKPARAGPAQVFLPLLNEGTAPRKLVRVTTPAAETAALVRGGDGDATRLEALTLRPGRLVNLAAWRAHIRLTGLMGPLKAGDSFPVTLHLADGATLTVSVVVQAQPGH